MHIVIQKFGGASLSTADYIKHVASLVTQELNKQSSVVVVVSAMAHVTDNLIKKMRAIAGNVHCDAQRMEYDALLASGEQISAALLALALQKLGFKARSWLAWQLPLKSNSTFGNAQITHVTTKKIRVALSQGEIPIIAGFQCINQNDRVTTLGRGGTDITALAISAALSASRCDLYKEVMGVFTANPYIVADAKKIDFISYKEMLELSSSGAKVLHSRAAEIAMRYKVPTKILPTFTNNAGTTLVDEAQIVQDNVITAIAHHSNHVMITIIGMPTTKELDVLLRLLAEKKIDTDTIINHSVQNQIILAFTIRSADLSQLKALLRNYKNILRYNSVNVKDMISKISLIGSGMQSYPETIRNVLKILAEHKIEVLLLSTSEIKLSIFMHKRDTVRATQILHKLFINKSNI